MNALTHPQLLNFLNAAIANGTVDLQQAVTDFVRTAIEHRSPQLRDAYMSAWFDDHAGRSLVGFLRSGIITSLHEMPTDDADMVHATNPTRTLIVATWAGETR